MATLKDLKEKQNRQIELINRIKSLGITNLNNKGVYASENDSIPTIMSKISQIDDGYFGAMKNILEGNSVINIPYGITKIQGYAFRDNSFITSITIPDSVISIENGAFADCSGLQELTIPLSFAQDGYRIFSGFTNVEKIILTKGLSDILDDYNSLYSNRPWYVCKSKEILLEDGITNIGNYMFWDCKSLTSITIPSSVTSIGDWAFNYCTGLTSITIPSSVTSIGERAFDNCSNLTSITIPSSVTRIGKEVFYNCPNLKSLYITDLAAWCNIVFDGFEAGLTRFAENLYLNGELVTNIVIPETVTSIGNYAFLYCFSLTSVTIPDSVTSIGDCAFYGCYDLTNVIIGNSVTSIGTSAFHSTGFTSITIPSSVTSIGDWAFSGCDGLISVIIPASVTSIGMEPFSVCTRLTEIAVDTNNEYYSNDEYGVLFNKDKTILIQYPAGNTRTEYIIPDSVTTIGNSAFKSCRSLTSVTIGNSVTSIGEGAFSGCSGLTSITIPSSVTSIGDWAFSNYDDSLTTINVPWSEGEVAGAPWGAENATINYNYVEEG